MTSSRLAVITGAAGFIGAHVRSALHAAGWTTRNLDLRAHHLSDRLDVRHPIPASVFAGAEVVVHLAALGGVRGSWDRPRDYWATNVAGTRHVLRSARRAGIGRVVVASSSSVYGECSVPAHEDATTAPLSPYARTKVATERLALAAAGADLEVVVIRPFTVYGPGQRPDMLLSRLLAGELLEVWPFERDLTYVGDLAPALSAACDAPMARPWEVVNLGAGRPVAAGELLEAVTEVTGSRPMVRWAPRGRGEPVRTWADPTRARDWLGFNATTPLADGIAAQAREVLHLERAV